MLQVTFKGQPVKLSGEFPKVGQKINNFKLTANNLEEKELDSYHERLIVLNIFPSLDTPVCANSVINFNKAAAELKDSQILCVSKDLPFAQARFCSIENIKNAQTLSAFRDHDFAKQLGIDITDGALRGLLARCIVVLDADHKVVYTQLVPEIAEEPNYQHCLNAIKNM